MPDARTKLLLELGRGGMGTVYLAAVRGPAGFRKLKVIKRLRADLAADPQFLQMFLEEARLAARLSHPNIVQTNDVGFDGVHYFIDMEYLEGVSLDAFLKMGDKHGGCPTHIGLWILTQVLEGLHHAHELAGDGGQPLRIVHRDVSPHNVLVTYDGSIKLLDFGIAKAADSTLDTSTGVVKGKVTYMAPEQAAKRHVDRRADVFSVGVMMWQMLTGRRLWSDLSDAEIYSKLEKGELASPKSVNGAVPDELDAMCLKALAPDPDGRYSTAAEFQADLERHLEATGLRLGPKPLSALLTTWFADRRAAVRAEVDEQFREEDPANKRDADVPPLGYSASREMAGGEMTTTNTVSAAKKLATKLDGSGRAATPTTRARRWRVLALPAGCALLVTATALVWRLRAQSPSANSNPGSTSGAGASRSGCATNAACTKALGVAGLCTKDEGACVPLETPLCHAHAEPSDLANDATIWFGAMLPLSGPRANQAGDANAIDLARRDFVTMTGGLPSSKRAGPTRPLGVVICDEAQDAAAAAHHLVDDLHVPAIIGFSDAKEVVQLTTSLFIPTGTLAVASLVTSPLITHIPHPPNEPPLVWRTAPCVVQEAAAIARVVSDVEEPELRRMGVVSPTGRVRVVLARGSTGDSISFSDAVVSALSFNGKAVVDNGDAFTEVDIPSSGDDTAAVGRVIDAHPNVILCVVPASTCIRGLLAPLEARWPMSRPYPLYVMASTATNGVYDFVGSNAGRRHRILAVDTPASTPANVKFAFRYNDVFSPTVTPGTAPSTSYDAFYLAAYAAYAVGEQRITGLNMAQVIGRLVGPGKPLDVGPSQILDVVNELHEGRNVDLNGSGSALDFDLTTGENSTDFAIFCLKADASGHVVDTVESGLRFDARTGALVGQITHCDRTTLEDMTR
jgi:serine/threonine protein kinase/ABC-type branched-subunit amino acid transport system substrate-binding protein